MKRLVTMIGLTLVIAAMSTTSTNAQIPFSYGFKVGMNSSNVTGDDADGFKSRSGIVGGLFVRVNIPGKFSIQPELLYSRKGAKYDRKPGEIFSRTLTFDYLEIPVLIRYKLAGTGPVSTSLFSGPAFAFAKSSETVFDPPMAGMNDVAALNNYNHKSTDIGLVLGVAIDVSVLSIGISFDIRYTAGLSSLWDDVEPGNIPRTPLEEIYADLITGAADDMKNSTLSFTLGVTF